MTLGHRSTTCLRGLSVASAAAMVLLLTACNGSANVEPAQAKKSILSIVDETTTAVGGEWSVYSEPTAESCGEGAGDGFTYTTIVMQDAPTADPARAVAAVEQLWKDKGITTERYRTGAADPIVGVRGRGGPSTSMDFLADQRRFSVVGVSECAAGSAVEERKKESGTPAAP